MRLPALLSAAILSSLPVVPLHGQAVLPSRAFDTTAAVGAGLAVPSAEWWRNGGPRVRPVGDRMASVLAAGLDRSAVVRRLVRRVEEGDVIVYVEMNPRLNDSLAGCITFVGQGAGFRYLRAMLNPNLPTDLLIASLAHELHHVAEVIDAPYVQSTSALISLYRRIGFPTRATTQAGWETEAARQVTFAVRRELAQATDAVMARREGPADADRRQND